MANIHYWIQLENHAWDVAPNNVDRMTGQTIKDLEQAHRDPADVTLTSPTSGASHHQTMFRPLRDVSGGTQNAPVQDALILRRYTEHWAAPADRKLNPWDLNEPDPTDSGTMGTIPGPTIECQVGDSVTVHFRNMDLRTHTVMTTINVPIPTLGGVINVPISIPLQEPLPVEQASHSLHPHGFVFAPTSDGAYPLSPPDLSQPIGVNELGEDETAAWASIGVHGHKQGDRVPPRGTFTYTWNTLGWPTTAGVWLYHDHSFCDDINVGLGAIGLIVIHNPANEEQEVDIRLPGGGVDQTDVQLDPAFLPGGSPNGSPVTLFCFRTPELDRFHLLPHDLAGFGGGGAMAMMQMAGGMEGEQARSTSRKDGPPVANRILRRGDLTFELNEELTAIRRLCIEFYQPPPSKALYLQLYHSLGDAGMCINGRKYLGNTPTMIAGPTTKMRFGVVAMGSDFHTFHIHGHRWIIPGPHGNTLNAIQTSPQDTPVSQFEDTRIMGPANSLAFTIQESAALPSFMRAEPAIGEWHMHCHVLQHMMDGMMGSLLVIHPNGGLAFALPQGKPCPAMGGMGGMGGTGNGGSHADVTVDNFQFTPHDVTVPDGGQVTFHFQQANHTVMTVSNTNADPIAINNGGGPADPVPPGSNRPVTIHGMSGGRIDYQCGIHGASMSGTIHIA